MSEQQQPNDLTVSLEQKEVPSEDNNKDKKSVNKRTNDSQNDDSVTSLATKRNKTRSASIDSKASSSWFWRSTKQPQLLSQEHHMEQDENNNTNGDSITDNGTDNSSNTISKNNNSGDDNNNNDNNDDNNDDSSNKKNGTKSAAQEHPPASGGLWSWLGYSTTEQKPNTKEDNEQNDNNSVVSGQSPSQKTSSSQSTTSTTTPEIQPSVETTKTDSEQEQKQEQQRPNNSTNENRTYWRSFFWSSQSDSNNNNNNNNNQDSVVIEKSSSTETRTSATTTDTPAIVIPKSNKRNVVVPTIESQLYPPSETSEHNSTSLLNKALKAINSLFAQKSPPHVNTKFSKFIDDMKAHPEDIAGKKFVIVGVHGWFPTKLVRSVVGEPTGTSIKFCEQMVSGVRHYFEEKHGLVIPHHAITSIPLEWEGKVEERVDRLHKLLVDHPGWMDAFTSADVILWTTHSQGTPVSAMLIHRLLEEKRINLHTQSVCMLAMAGISHGPFPSLKGNLIVKYFEADAARELFHFMDSSSEISQKYRRSLNYLLRNGIKTILVGSLQDQVVPLYSAIMTGASHPNILRAVYVDGHIYSEDDFLINLVTFALRLRNAGLSDHGLLTHISEVLAGDLYSWEGGHSTIYEERGVYTMAVQYLFESAPFGRITNKSTDTAVDVLLDSFQAKVRQNPFYLPWAMRGICDDAAVLSDQILRQELQKLRTLFEQWVPANAKLREIKFRLEPLRARL